MKNIIFTIAVPVPGKEYRAAAYEYSINSWKNWAKKHDCEVVVLDTPILPESEMKIHWQKYYLFQLLDDSEIDYDQVLLVDSDTIVHPDCPNFFNMSEHEYCAVHNLGSYDWVIRSIENYAHSLFGKPIPFWTYINTGFQIINGKHKEFFNSILQFHNEHHDVLNNLTDKFGNGVEQTPVNFLLNEHGIDVKLLPYKYNAIDMDRHEILRPDMLHAKLTYVMHFNSIPNDPEKKITAEIMEKTYNYLYNI